MQSSPAYRMEYGYFKGWERHCLLVSVYTLHCSMSLQTSTCKSVPPFEMRLVVIHLRFDFFFNRFWRKIYFKQIEYVNSPCKTWRWRPPQPRWPRWPPRPHTQDSWIPRPSPSPLWKKKFFNTWRTVGVPELLAFPDPGFGSRPKPTFLTQY